MVRTRFSYAYSYRYFFGVAAQAELVRNLP
jgi:hypothetical protein